MELDLDNAEQISDFVSVPAGTYVCEIEEVRERHTRAGDDLWALRLVVAEGEFVGRHAAWDNLVFSSRGLNRVKPVLKALGLPADGKVELTPEQLKGRKVLVDVRPAEYHSPEGVMTRRNEIPYDGYRPLTGGTGGTGTPAEDSMPF